MAVKKWAQDCLPAGLWNTAQRLAPCVQEQKATLAGGTALALHYGHRLSVDLDFFCAEPIRHERILSHLRKAGEVTVLVEDPESLVCRVGTAKVSFFRHEYPFLPPQTLDGIPIADPLDIAAMKIIAITQRGLKRDFVDLYCLLQSIPFFQIARHAHSRYGKGRIHPMVVGKALVYFADAEGEPDPVYPEGKPLAWKKIRTFFERHLKQLVLDLDTEAKG